MSFDFLQLSYMQNGLAAAMLVGCSCAVAGIFIVLRRMVFVSMVLAQLAVLGLSIGISLGLPQHIGFLLTFGTTLLGVLVLAFLPPERSLPADAALGMGFAACHAFSLLLLAKSTQGLEEVRHLMSGNLLSVTSGEVRLLGVATAIMLLTHMVGHRAFVFLCVDTEFAHVAGLQVRRWEALFHVTLGLVISLALHLTGTFYVFSSLVFPAMVGITVVNTFAAIQVVSLIIAVLSAFCGVWFSFAWDLPTSEAIIAIQVALFAGAFLASSLRKRWYRQAEQRSS